jgi:hypothetical protein
MTQLLLSCLDKFRETYRNYYPRVSLFEGRITDAMLDRSKKETDTIGVNEIGYSIVAQLLVDIQSNPERKDLLIHTLLNLMLFDTLETSNLILDLSDGS